MATNLSEIRPDYFVDIFKTLHHISFVFVLTISFFFRLFQQASQEETNC